TLDDGFVTRGRWTFIVSQSGAQATPWLPQQSSTWRAVRGDQPLHGRRASAADPSSVGGIDRVGGHPDRAA
ncbi:MAG: hypothetical protein M3432_01495, partial [Chloroflexota bacterium]|nr:hypothetical protein [Chloroflexota bacterium]